MQVGTELFHDLVLASRRDCLEHRDVERGEPTGLEPEFQTSPPLGFGGAGPGDPSTIQAKVPVQGRVVEAQQQMPADRVGSQQPLPDQIEMGDARMARRTPLHTFTGEPFGDPSDQAGRRRRSREGTVSPCLTLVNGRR